MKTRHQIGEMLSMVGTSQMICGRVLESSISQRVKNEVVPDKSSTRVGPFLSGCANLQHGGGVGEYLQMDNRIGSTGNQEGEQVIN